MNIPIIIWDFSGLLCVCVCEGGGSEKFISTYDEYNWIISEEINSVLFRLIRKQKPLVRKVTNSPVLYYAHCSSSKSCSVTIVSDIQLHKTAEGAGGWTS